MALIKTNQAVAKPTDLQLLVYQGQAPPKQKYPVISSSWTKNCVSVQKSKYNSNQDKQDAYVRLENAYIPLPEKRKKR